MPTLLTAISHNTSSLTSLVVALVSLSGVLGAAFASLLSARKGVYTSSITVERSKWLDKLRGNLASYSAELIRCSIQVTSQKQNKVGLFSRFVQSDGDTEFLNRFHRIEELSSTLRLQLNPKSQIDNVLIFLLENVGIQFVHRPKDINRFNSLLIKHSQWLLKDEWEKVKWEAGGPLHRLWHLRDKGKRRRAYNKFLSGEGDVVALFSLAIANKVQREQGLDWITEEQYEKLVLNVRPEQEKASWIVRKSQEITIRKIRNRIKLAFTKSDLPLTK